MSLHGTYDPQNIFALIIRGDLPCYKLYEDDDVLAFLDLFPQSKGHSLVIPKRAAARNILDIDDASLAKVMAVLGERGSVQDDAVMAGVPRAEAPALLRALIEQGVDIDEARWVGADLESVFMTETSSPAGGRA